MRKSVRRYGTSSVTSPSSTPDSAVTDEALVSASPSKAEARRPSDEFATVPDSAAVGDADAVLPAQMPSDAAEGPVIVDVSTGEAAAAAAAPAVQRPTETAEVTRLDPTVPRRPMGPGPGAVGRPQGQPGPGGPGRARPIGAVGGPVAGGGPRPGGPGGPGAAQRRPQPGAVVAVVPRHDGASTPEGQAIASALPRNAQDVARGPIVKPVNDDDYAEAVPLPSRRPLPPKPPVKPVRQDTHAGYIPGPAALPATMRRRHWGLVLFFLLTVIMPATFYGWYLYARAADQYESDAGFGSRTEDAPSTFAFLGALGGSGVSSTKDMDILNQFIASQELVTRADKRLDLRTIFSKPQNDPWFSFPKDGSTEDLVKYWKTMVLPSYDSGTGLMSLRVFAFEPQDAQNIARVVLEESTAIINEMSTTAQADATRYSAETLANAEKRLAAAQQRLTDFRIKNHIVDPQSQMAGASQVINTLVQQLGTAEIDLDMLEGTLPETDMRITQLKRRIEVIQKRMDEESSKVGGLADTDSPGYAKLMVDYQNLQMEQDFSQKAYLASLSAYDQAVNDAQHKTRYLTTYLTPTLAESSTAPDRPLRILMALLVGFLIWSSVVMIYYALRDRR